MPVRYLLSSVWVRLSIFSQLSIVHYMRLCVFSLPISLIMTEKIYTLSYYHYQIGSMNYYPLFRVRSWNNGVCCMSVYILILILIVSHNGFTLTRWQKHCLNQWWLVYWCKYVSLLLNELNCRTVQLVPVVHKPLEYVKITGYFSGCSELCHLNKRPSWKSLLARGPMKKMQTYL